MSVGMQKTFAWCGVAFILMLFPGMMMLGLFPPWSPATSAAQTAHIWSTHTILKRCGCAILIAASLLQGPFGLLIATRVKKMEGEHTPFTYGMIYGTGLAVLVLFWPIFAYGATAFRPERNPEITQALSDLSWIFLVGAYPAAITQCCSIAFGILGYRGSNPVWPRWLGYFNLWMALFFTGGGIDFMFKNGLFAWNGFFTFWTEAVGFVAWFVVMTWQLLATIPEFTTSKGEPEPGRESDAKPADVVSDDPAMATFSGGPATATSEAHQTEAQQTTATLSSTRIPGESGIWVFVLPDLVVFGIFFVSFTYLRAKSHAAFATDQLGLNLALGTVNTILLLTSSLLVVRGVISVSSANHRGAPRLFGAALFCGSGFVAVKILEWSNLFLDGRTVNSSEFYMYYFLFTGIHLLHVLFGCIVLGRLVLASRSPRLTSRQLVLCESGGIYWHMVDFLWIVLFGLFYLVR